MRNIEFVDRYTIQFHKPWTDDEKDVAACIGMRINNDVILADTRVISPQSVKEFMILCFPVLMLSDSQKVFRESVFSILKDTYKGIYSDFLHNYYPKTGYNRELFNHQKRALSLMIHRQYNLLSFEQGLGKTVTSATMSKILGVSRTIVIAPAGVKWNWYHDMTDDWGYDKMLWTILDSKKSKSIFAFNERFVVCNYEMIDKHFGHLTKYNVGHIIIDECQKIKNVKTANFKAVHKLVKHFPKARVTLLSGTPITNRVNDIFAYFKLCNHPLGFNYSAFIKRYTINQSGRGGVRVIGAQNTDELRLKISNFMIRKRAEECLDLPALLIKKYYFEMGDVKGEYEQHVKALYDHKKELEEAKTTQEQSEIKMKIKGNIHTMNRLLATSKVKNIIPLIDQLVENDRDVIVFSGYRDPIHALEAHYGDACVKVIGGMDASDKDKAIQKFTKNPNCRIFLGNFKAAGVGINLVNSRDVIFLNFPFTPDDLEQPYKRAHRIGQKEKVNVYYTIVKESIDEHIFNMITDKTQDINTVLDEGKDGVVHYQQIPNDLFNRLVEQYEIKNNIPQKEFVSLK